MKADSWRSLDYYDPSKDKDGTALIIGCGSIGSYCAFGLARMGVKNIILVDHDFVEPHNLPQQFFGESIIKGNMTLKVLALKATIESIVKDVNIITYPEKIETALNDIYTSNRKISMVVFALDSMEVRKWCFESFKGLRGAPMFSETLFTDIRIGGEFANVYCWGDEMGSASWDHYSTTLYTDGDAIQLPCTGTQTIDVNWKACAEIIKLYRHTVNGIDYFYKHLFIDGHTSLTFIMEAHSNPQITAPPQSSSVTGDNVNEYSQMDNHEID